MSVHKEIRALTGLRGIAALYVVLFHSTGSPSPNPFYILLNHGYLAVDVFFVLSGFVLAINYRHIFNGVPFWRAYSTFLGRRIARIYPLYLCGTIAAYFLARYHGLSPAMLSQIHNAIPLNLLLMQAWFIAPSLNAPGWSLSAEWAAYLLFPALLSLVFFKPDRRHWIGLLVCLAAVAAFARLPALYQRPTFPFTNQFFNNGRNQVLRCLPEFTLGVALVRGLGTTLARALERLFSARPWTVTLLCLGLFGLLMVQGLEIFFVLMLPLLLLSLMQPHSLPALLLSSGPAYYLGLISYSLYIVHTLFRGAAVRVHLWAQLHHLQHAQSYAAAAVFILALPTSVLAYHYIELPSSRLLRRWFEGSSPRNGLRQVHNPLSCPSPCLSPQFPIDS